MYLIGAGSRYDVDNTPHAASVLRVKSAGLDAELLNGIGIRIRFGYVCITIIVVGVVQKKIGSIAARTVDRNRNVIVRHRRWC